MNRGNVQNIIVSKDCSTLRKLVRLTMYRNAVFLFLAGLVCTTMAIAVNLALNPQAPFAGEVKSIHHYVHNREIAIELKLSRKCQKPTFRIRISGASLHVLRLKKVESDMLVYSYPELIDEGVYFVEVIALLCDPFDPEAFSTTCLVRVVEGKGVVTLPYTFQVKANETNKAVANPRPRWVLPDKSKASLLPTRYQKIVCPKQKNGWCSSKPSDLWQHDLYEWVDSPDYSNLLRSVFSLSRKDEINQHADSIVRVCIIGDSHGRDLVMFGNKLNVDGAEFVYIKTIYPPEFNVSSLDTHNCTYAVASFGQWPGSFRTEGHPYTQTKYDKEMRRVISFLQQYDHTRTQVFVHSVNYHALMAMQTSCPPTDFRTPPLIDMYNAVLRNLCREFNVEFIDMNHIMGPLWDSAPDWCHPSGKIYTAEAKWILHYVLQSTLKRQHAVTLFPQEVAHGALVRFGGTNAVYLLHKGEIRAFPDGTTFLLMRYSFNDVKDLSAEQRKHVKLGPDLPVISQF